MHRSVNKCSLACAHMVFLLLEFFRKDKIEHGVTFAFWCGNHLC
jgi:hypothetical protein